MNRIGNHISLLWSSCQDVRMTDSPVLLLRPCLHQALNQTLVAPRRCLHPVSGICDGVLQGWQCPPFYSGLSSRGHSFSFVTCSLSRSAHSSFLSHRAPLWYEPRQLLGTQETGNIFSLLLRKRLLNKVALSSTNAFLRHASRKSLPEFQNIAGSPSISWFPAITIRMTVDLGIPFML